MKLKLGLISLVLLMGVSTACASKPESNATNASGGGTKAAQSIKATDPYPNAQLLADVKWVEEKQKDSKVIIIDGRSKGYEQGHIPGAISVNAGLLKDSKNNTIISKEAFTELFQKAGVNSDSTVLLYDEGGEGNAATRIFYGLEYYGLKDKVKILNGGYLAWTIAGKPVSTDVPTPAKGNFAAVPNDKLITTKDQLLKADLAQCSIIDTRSAAEYTGTDLRGNKNGGHVNGSVNQEWNQTVDKTPADGVAKFKNYKDLTEMYAAVGITDKNKTVIPYCQTNIRGAHTYFILRLLGFKDVRPYEGSMAEWANSDDAPLVK